jgi:hypothetical protein
MGDRGNIYVVQHPGKDKPESGIFFYSHWTGTDLPETLQAALKRGQGRWDDEQYLARIIFCEMIRHDGLDEITGFGISTYICDNEHPILVVDCDKAIVGISKEPRGGGVFPNIERETSFAEYITLDAKALREFVSGKPETETSVEF